MQIHDEDDYLWSLQDGDDFNVLLVDRLDRFLHVLDSRMTAVDLFLRRIHDVAAAAEDDDGEISVSSFAAVDDTAIDESDERFEPRLDLPAVDDHSLATADIDLNVSDEQDTLDSRLSTGHRISDLTSSETLAVGDSSDVTSLASALTTDGDRQRQPDCEDRLKVERLAAQSLNKLFADTVHLARILRPTIMLPPYPEQHRRECIKSTNSIVWFVFIN